MSRTVRSSLALVLVCVATIASRAQSADPTVFINEIHYDNAGTDVGEFIEIAGPAGTDLSTYSLVLYNGSTGLRYDTDVLSGTIPNQQGGFGTVSLAYPVNGLQNGSPDAIALVHDGAVVQFLSYEGAFTAVDGPAGPPLSLTSTDIGVSESGFEAAGLSLQLKGSGDSYADFTWASASDDSPAAINPGQSFATASSLSINDVSVTEGNAGTTTATFTVSLTSAAGPGGVSFSISTDDGTAVAGADYTTVATTATIPEGSSNHTFNVPVLGDLALEGDETFVVNITNVVNADVADAQGLGTIVDDETAPPTFVVINELDSDTPGTDAAEFIELFDGGVGHTVLNGLTVVFYNGSNDLSYAAFDLDGYATDANGYFTLGNSAVPGVDLAFPGNLLQNGADAVALFVANATNFPNNTPITTTNLLDAIVYDTADADDAGLLALLNAGQPQIDENSNGPGDQRSIQRCPNGEGGARNSSGYVALVPTPGAANGPCPEPPPPAVRRTISEIQGTTDASPFADTVVVTTGVVTGRKVNGFFLQEQTPDANVQTSDAIFVFTATAPEVVDSGVARLVALGDVLDVSGRVVEFRRNDAARPESLTEITGPLTLTLLGEGQPLPAPIDAASILNPAALSRVMQLEAYESMLVSLGDARAVSPTNNFGEFFAVLAGIPRPFREPGITSGDPLPADAPSPNNIPTFDGNFERIMIETDEQTTDAGLRRAALAVSTGATISGVWGPLDYAFDDYRIQVAASAAMTAVGGLNAAVPVPSAAANEFTIGAANLLNFANPTATRLAKGTMMIRDILRAPAVLGVIEVGDLASLQQLTDAVNASAGTSYQAYLLPAGGTQHVGYLVDTGRVEVVEEPAQLFKDKTFTFAGIEDVLHDRPPLVMKVNMRRAGGVQSFPVTIMLLHLKSLIEIDSNAPYGSGATLGARNREKRRLGAEDVAQAIEDRQNENLVVLGDLNAFEFNDGYVDVVGTLRGTPAPADEVVESSVDVWDHELVNLIDTIANPEERYSYTFGGSAQTLDHVLVNAPMLARFSSFRYARNNADFAYALSTDASRPERFSDHDAPVAYFTFPALSDLSVAVTAPDTATAGAPLTYSVVVSNSGPDVAQNVSLSLPANAALGTVTLTEPSGWTCSSSAAGAVSCTTAAMNAQSTATFVVQTSAGCAVADGTLLSQTATVTTSTPEVTLNNNTSAYTTTASNSTPTISAVSASHTWLLPNHQWVPVQIAYQATDSCGAVTSTLSVTSNEPVTGSLAEQGIAGQTSPDWVIVDAHTLQLRAERSARGHGRVYTITITATDLAGGTTTQQVTITVPQQVVAGQR
jgi:uncharacterized repeat protein (TIGR01451 family)